MIPGSAPLIGAYLVSAYLLGSLCSGWFLVRVFAGADLRTLGSQTIGARNTGRILGPAGFLGALAGDCLKGAIVVVSALVLELPSWALALGMVLVIAGHTWPVWLKFHGGKGLATFLGALFWFDLRLMGLFFVAWGICYVVTRHLSLACLIAVGLVPVLALALMPLPQLIFFQAGPNAATAVGLFGQAALVLVSHAPNIKEYAGQMTARRALASEMANA